MSDETPRRSRIPTLSEVDELVVREVSVERRSRELTYEWLNARLTTLEGKVVVWGAIPTVATTIVAIFAYLYMKR